MHLWYKVHWRTTLNYKGYGASNNYQAFPKWTQNICLLWFVFCQFSLEIIMVLQIKMVTEYAFTMQRMYACLTTLFRYLLRWFFNTLINVTNVNIHVIKWDGMVARDHNITRQMQTERVRVNFWYIDCHSGHLPSIDWMNVAKFSCILFYHIFTPISVDITHWINFLYPTLCISTHVTNQ